MNPSPQPYFFPEAMRVGWRALERERLLGIDGSDIRFLGNVFIASDAGRRSQAPPMIAQRIWLNKNTAGAVELAGSFMMSSTQAYPHAFLYTPYGGLEKFDSRASLLAELTARLKTPAQATQLLCFLPLQWQASQVLDENLVLTPGDMPTDVFGEQEKTLNLYQDKNRQAMLRELQQLPTLGNLVSQLLKQVCRPLFTGLDPAAAHVSFFARQPADSKIPRWLDSLPINDAVLMFYREQAWPSGQIREFFHPDRGPDPKDPQRQAHDARRWESAIKQAAGQLIPFLQSCLETFWNTDMSPGVSRRAWFAQAMAANARLDLLLKRQQSIISAEQSRELTPLYQPEGADAQAASPPLRFEQVRVWENAANVVSLASTLMIGNAKTFLYTPDKGLQVLGDYDDLMNALKAMVKSPGYEDDLYNLMTLEEQRLFIGFKAPQFSGARLHGNLFEHLCEDIIGKQQQNLGYVLDLYRRNRGGIEASALTDHALDVRYMIDSRLPAMDTAGRWTPHSVLSDPTRPTSLTGERALRLQRQLKSIEQSLAAQIRAQPTLKSTVSLALTAEMSRRHLPTLLPEGIYINRYVDTASEKESVLPLESQTLSGYFLGRLTQGRGPVPQTPHYGLYSARTLGNLDIPQANAVMQAALVYLRNHDIANIPREPLEQLKASMAHAMSVAIQGEAGLRCLNHSLDGRDEAIVNTVFDLQHPDRRRRRALNGFIPDAYALSVEQPGLPQRIPLAHCLILTERGGLDPHHSGRAILWTPARGLESFATVPHLQAELKRRLANPERRMEILENLDPRHPMPHQRYTLGAFLLIDRAVAEHRQQSWIEHYIGQRAYGLTLNLSGDALLKYFAELEKALPANDLEHTSRIAGTLMLQQSLPAWLGMATVMEQKRHVEILEQYRHSLKDDADYLEDIEPLTQYVHDKLNELLADHGVYPEQVHIVPRLVLAGQRQTLVDYALNHINQQAATFDVESRASGLTPSVVRQILARLTLRQDQQAALAEKLTPGKPGALAREQRFVRQLPWQLLQHAHALKLQEQLSPAGLSLIEQVIDMPDAVARATVKDATASIRPLALIATAGARAVKALGIYLINSPEKKPLVMYAPYCPQATLMEFDSETDLVQRLNVPGVLQDWVSGLLPESERATYKNLWASTLGTPSEITLAASPIMGHALKQLYRDNIALISHLFEQQTRADGRCAWETLKDLFNKGLQHSRTLLPGKLMLPLVIWQSYTLFKASAEDLQQHRWREALTTFIGGVAQIASMRELMHAPPISNDTPEPPAQEEKASAWADIDITAPQRTRLQSYESDEVNLGQLTAASSGVFTSPDNRHYLPYARKVYRAEPTGGTWRLFSAQSKGPCMRLDNQHKWALDTRPLVRRHGPGFSRMLERRDVRTEVRRVMNVEARGMAEIRRVSPNRAQMIVDALDLATFYLHNCQQNLKLLDPKYPPVTRVHRFITSFFGIPIDPGTGANTLPVSLVKTLQHTVTAILDEVLEPSLYSLNSNRFVSGAHIAEPERHWAFTIDDDPDRRIYLSERFFNPPNTYFEGRLINHFDSDAHARATTVIHELTHIVKNTVDAVYLNASSPFSDLIDVQTQAGRDLQTWLKGIQENSYSVSTPVGELFKSLDATGAIGPDLGTDPDTDYIRDQILETTGGADLSDARGIFKTHLTQRFHTQMDNADSLTLLITTLGRQLDPVPATPATSP